LFNNEHALLLLKRLPRSLRLRAVCSSYGQLSHIRACSGVYKITNAAYIYQYCGSYAPIKQFIIAFIISCTNFDCSVRTSSFFKFDFIHGWSVALVNTIKTTSFTPPSVIKLHLLFAYAFTCFGFLVNHLQKAHQLFKGKYHYMIHSYNK
jgi:hypothetical protein